MFLEGSFNLRPLGDALEKAWRTLGWWKTSLPMTQGLDLDVLGCSFHSKPFHDSVDRAWRTLLWWNMSLTTMRGWT